MGKGNSCTVCGMSLGLTLGVLGGFAMLVMGLLSLKSGYIGELFQVTSSIYPGTGSTGLGVLIGLVWGFADGFIGGVLIAWLYNMFSGKCCGKCCKGGKCE